ncbi:MAG: hypothetical protein PHQ43_10320 [Dehalococcoidales bacterium]|nr:hypothetical protein [Dehalococcoidales bacterium]
MSNRKFKLGDMVRVTREGPLRFCWGTIAGFDTASRKYLVRVPTLGEGWFSSDYLEAIEGINRNVQKKV